MNNELTDTEYREKLRVLSELAKSEDRISLGDFIDELLSSEKVNKELLVYIYTSADEITLVLADYYKELLRQDAELAWYEIFALAGEEKEFPEKYYEILYTCFEDGIDAKIVKEWVDSSMSPEILLQKHDKWEQEKENNRVREYNSSDMFIQHLQSENERLEKRLEKDEEELATVREELKKTMEKSFSDRKAMHDYRFELEQIKEKSGRAEASVKLAEKKIDKYKAMCIHMEETVRELREIKKQAEDKCREMMNDQEDRKALKLIIEEKNAEIKELSMKISNYKELFNNGNEDVTTETNRENESIDFGNFDDSFTDGNIPETWNDLASASEPDMIPDMWDDVETLSEPEDIDYDQGSIIAIEDNEEQIVKHSNLFAKIYLKYQEKRFLKKPASEQDNMIFAKMVEHEVPEDLFLKVKNALKNNAYLSRIELYRLICMDAPEREILDCCVPSAV